MWIFTIVHFFYSTDVPISLDCDCLQVQDKAAKLAAGFADDCTSCYHKHASGYLVEMVSTIGSE